MFSNIPAYSYTSSALSIHQLMCSPHTAPSTPGAHICITWPPASWGRSYHCFTEFTPNSNIPSPTFQLEHPVCTIPGASRTLHCSAPQPLTLPSNNSSVSPPCVKYCRSTTSEQIAVICSDQCFKQVHEVYVCQWGVACSVRLESLNNMPQMDVPSTWMSPILRASSTELPPP